MKRQGKVFNADMVRVGRRMAAWGVSGMNWADGPARDAGMVLARKVRANRGLCEALGRASQIHGDEFANQSGVTALIEAVMGDHTWRVYMLNQMA